MLKGDAKKRGQPGKKWLLLPNSHSDCDLKTHEKKRETNGTFLFVVMY